MPDRRAFLKQVSVAAAGAAVLTHRTAHAQPRRALPMACNDYTWKTYFQREDRDYIASLDTALGQVKASGLTALEPAFASTDELAYMVPLLKQHGLAMPSLYVNSTLHEADQAEASIAAALAIATQAQAAMGTSIIVTNPSPIRWGGPENKTDDQLLVQAEALNRLGQALHERGLTLSYHTHDPEFRAGAREFHHMLLATDPTYVTFCCDAHWVFRGAGDSQVALFDVLTLYGHRITELHIRQSQDGIWTEVLGPGDIDYERFVQTLVEMGVYPHVVLEQAPEQGTPHTMDAIAVHRASMAYLRETFAPLVG